MNDEKRAGGEGLLAGRTAFVTGGSRGIGRAICLGFAAHGADVAFNFQHNVDAAQAVREAVEARGRRCLTFQASVGDREAVARMLRETQGAFGGLDILVNNAGIARDGLMAMMTDAAWAEVIETNLTGAFYCSRVAVKLMMRKKAGAIVNIASLTGAMGQPGQANYAASKGGLIGFTKALAAELAGQGIRVNAVVPGFIETEMLGGMQPEVLQRNRETIPMGRFGTAEEVANAALFLASDLASYVTGAALHVNGGLYR